MICATAVFIVIRSHSKSLHCPTFLLCSVFASRNKWYYCLPLPHGFLSSVLWLRTGNVYGFYHTAVFWSDTDNRIHWIFTLSHGLMVWIFLTCYHVSIATLARFCYSLLHHILFLHAVDCMGDFSKRTCQNWQVPFFCGILPFEKHFRILVYFVHCFPVRIAVHETRKRINEDSEAFFVLLYGIIAICNFTHF